MKFEITPENAILSMKIWLQPVLGWPPPLNASRNYLILHTIAWCIAFFCISHLIPTGVLHAMRGTHEPAEVMKDFAECLALLVTSMKMIICKCQQSRLQVALADMEEFLNTSDSHERELVDKYIKRYGKYYASVEVLCVVSGAAFACGPIFLPQPLPGHAEYPFEWKDSRTIYVFLYITHIIGVVQSCGAVMIDIQIAMILWILGIRLELLGEDFENARTSEEFGECVKEHQKLIASVDDITITVRYFALNVVMNTCITNICAGYQFISHQSLEVVLQFFLLLSIASVEVAMYTWPADNLLTVNENISHAVYKRPWFDDPQKITTGLQIVMIRSQKPMVISIDGLLPVLNLDFYAKYLTTTFSYFTTLRAFVG